MSIARRTVFASRPIRLAIHTQRSPNAHWRAKHHHSVFVVPFLFPPMANGCRSIEYSWPARYECPIGIFSIEDCPYRSSNIRTSHDIQALTSFEYMWKLWLQPVSFRSYSELLKPHFRYEWNTLTDFDVAIWARYSLMLSNWIFSVPLLHAVICYVSYEDILIRMVAVRRTDNVTETTMIFLSFRFKYIQYLLRRTKDFPVDLNRAPKNVHKTFSLCNHIEGITEHISIEDVPQQPTQLLSVFCATYTYVAGYGRFT